MNMLWYYVLQLLVILNYKEHIEYFFVSMDLGHNSVWNCFVKSFSVAMFVYKKQSKYSVNSLNDCTHCL